MAIRKRGVYGLAAALRVEESARSCLGTSRRFGAIMPSYVLVGRPAVSCVLQMHAAESEGGNRMIDWVIRNGNHDLLPMTPWT